VRQQQARLQLVLIAAVFLGPLAVAAWLYFQGDSLHPVGRSNHGALLEPIVNLHESSPGSEISDRVDTVWLLVYVNDGLCSDSCRDALYTTRQSRLMLGKEMDRLDRVLLHGASTPDTVFLAQEHPGLITIEDGRLHSLLIDKKPADLQSGGYFLIDPLGNLVLYFPPDLDPADMVDDIKHLLKLSRIG